LTDLWSMLVMVSEPAGNSPRTLDVDWCRRVFSIFRPASGLPASCRRSHRLVLHHRSGHWTSRGGYSPMHRLASASSSRSLVTVSSGFRHFVPTKTPFSQPFRWTMSAAEAHRYEHCWYPTV